MKRVKIITDIKKLLPQLVMVMALLLLLNSPVLLKAQADSTQTDSTKVEEPEEEESSLISPSLLFYTIQKADNSIDMKVQLQAKVNGSNKKLPHLRVSFIQVLAEEEKELGYAITDISGKATFNWKGDKIVADKEGNLNLKAVFKGNKFMEEVEEELTIKRARLIVTPVFEDSVYSLQIKLVDLGTGTETPVAEAALGVFVQRMINPLKIAEATTDENGEASAEVPANLPGDQNGNLVMIVKLDEHELYGNLEASVTQKWGIPVSNIIKEAPRALWSAHPPIWMLVTFIILITVVWGHYLVIIYELIRLRKEEPHTNP